MRCRSCFLGVLLAVSAAAQNGDPAARLVDRIVANERAFLEKMKTMKPIVETYIQETAAGATPDSAPTGDHYLVGRLGLAGGVEITGFSASAAFHKARKRGPAGFSAEGFAQMAVIDSEEFNREAYEFEYVRREFLGEVRCLVFDVSPKDGKVAGKFVGRIWVEDRDYRIVRFNGTYSGSAAGSLFFHFDSWRVQATPEFWAPAFIYVEDAGGPAQGKKIRFKAQTRLWGYQAHQSAGLQELTAIRIDAQAPVSDPNAAKEVSPVESQRFWMRQASDNVLHKLEKSGLLAPKGEVEQVLNTVANNLMATNDIALDLECRVLLTTPLETFSIGQTIVISRGLLDVLPDEASLAMALTAELAHIVLGHPNQTMFAFSDQMIFEEREILNRLRLERTPQEIERASARAAEMLARSPYKEKLGQAALFLKVLASRTRNLPNLIQANLGNRLAGNHARIAELAGPSAELDENNLEQIAALPLGSRLRLDPWSGALTMIKSRPVALLSAREKMPFEVTPFAIHLARQP